MGKEILECQIVQMPPPYQMHNQQRGNRELVVDEFGDGEWQEQERHADGLLQLEFGQQMRLALILCRIRCAAAPRAIEAQLPSLCHRPAIDEHEREQHNQLDANH